jgi:hypothetical protein
MAGMFCNRILKGWTVADIWRIPVLLLAGSVTASCDSDSGPASGGSSGVQQRFAAEDFASPEALLRTGTDTGDVASFWFCTYLKDGEFSDRKQIHFLDSGMALVDGAEADWSYQQGILAISDGTSELALESVNFDSRLFQADQFTAASQDGIQLNCDWSGPARPGSILLNDAPEGSFAMNGDGIETLLLTGNIQNSRTSHWQCQSPENGWERSLYLFSDGTAEFDGMGRWIVTDINSFEITQAGDTGQWTDVVIAEDGDVLYDFFTATLNGETVECRWEGAPRASVYAEQQ